MDGLQEARATAYRKFDSLYAWGMASQKKGQDLSKDWVTEKLGQETKSQTTSSEQAAEGNEEQPLIGDNSVTQSSMVYGMDPMHVTCPRCQGQIQTITKTEPSLFTWVIGAVLCMTGMWLCACIPCCIQSLHEVEHKCPNCSQLLGRYKPSQIAPKTHRFSCHFLVSK